jgi:hypothetical protein
MMNWLVDEHIKEALENQEEIDIIEDFKSIHNIKLSNTTKFPVKPTNTLVHNLNLLLRELRKNYNISQFIFNNQSVTITHHGATKITIEIE